jgi:hypothetical protein
MGKQFDSEGDFFGEQWAPLSEPYATWKMQHYPGKGILSAEGDLRRAATTPERIARPDRSSCGSALPEDARRRPRAAAPAEHASGPATQWIPTGSSPAPTGCRRRPLLGDELPPRRKRRAARGRRAVHRRERAQARPPSRVRLAARAEPDEEVTMGDEEQQPAKIDETRSLATDDEGTAVETGQDGGDEGDEDAGGRRRGD